MTFEFRVKIIVIISLMISLLGCASVNLESEPAADRIIADPPPPANDITVPTAKAMSLNANPTVNSNQVTYDNMQRIKLHSAAKQGDAVAQFQLGEAYCCGEGFYDTDSAISWWCKAAMQAHYKAQERLREKLGTYSLSTCQQRLAITP